MQIDGTIGVDFNADNTFSLQRLNEGPNFGTQRQGDDHRSPRRQPHLHGDARGPRRRGTRRCGRTFAPRSARDYLNNEGEFSSASGSTQLAPGGQTVGRRSMKSASNQSPTATKTLGYYAQEQVALRDRLFLTGAVRYDQNTAFGTQYKGVPYPKFSASYNISDESFFPHNDFLNSLHLRLAYGSSGVQPGATSALRTFRTTTTNIVHRHDGPAGERDRQSGAQAGDVDGVGDGFRHARLEATR